VGKHIIKLFKNSFIIPKNKKVLALFLLSLEVVVPDSQQAQVLVESNKDSYLTKLLKSIKLKVIHRISLYHQGIVLNMVPRMV
jgi:hypothetical protein